MPNLQEGRVWTLDQTSFNVKVKGQGHHRKHKTVESCCINRDQYLAISWEQLNGFAPNSQGRRVWCLARKCSKVKVKGQSHQRQKTRLALLTPPAAYEWYALAENSMQQQRTTPYGPCRGMTLGACVPFIFGSSDIDCIPNPTISLLPAALRAA